MIPDLLLSVMAREICKRVACGISGGVDSAVSAHLLHKKGFDVVGVFMKNWDQTDETGKCSSDADLLDAQVVCDHLKIELLQVNFVKEYWHNVFCDMVQSYQTGFTPNPDVLCNKFIKFGSFFKHVKNNLNIDFIATGHYAQNSYGNFLEQPDPEINAKLMMAKDRWKDQTLFLSQISQEALRCTMFPIGDMLKKDVKRIAKEIGLQKIADKKESTGICFIGKRNFHGFIEDYIPPAQGRFIDIETDQVVGHHKGTHYWTIGQRALIPGLSHPYFIVKLEPKSQDILVAGCTHHPSLYSQSMYVTEPHWISSEPQQWLDEGRLRCQFKFQHVHQLQKCTLEKTIDGRIEVETELPIRALTPGQYSVFYLNDQCLGSAKILQTGESLYDKGYTKNFRNAVSYEQNINS